MKKLIVANWKLNPRTLTGGRQLLRALAAIAGRSKASVVFCPPTPYIASLRAEFPKLTLGAQDAFHESQGPYTGAVGPEELKSVGARFVIVGHSERRDKFGETDSMVAKKLKAVLAEGLTAILCVGEPLTAREKGMAASRRFVAQQLKNSLKNISSSSSLLIAYEPIWAISTSGSGKKDTPEDAVEMIRFIKKSRKTRVLYGGSADSKNAASFLARAEIDGLLVGGASLRAKEFAAVIKEADKILK
jgi:triosephosphate isomerase